MPRVTASSTKFIENNRRPRVHIAYELETNGAKRKVELPFVMGVMADLSGKSHVDLKPLEDRKFEDISVDNFDARMKSISPRVEFFVDRKLGQAGEGQDDKMLIDITFQSMADFSPEAIARKVQPLAELLKIREQLTNLMTWADGRSRAEELLSTLVDPSNKKYDPVLLRAVASLEHKKQPDEGGETKE